MPRGIYDRSIALIYPKAKRNLNITRLILTSDKTLKQIGEKYGITKQRVSQIIKRQTGETPKKVKANLLAKSTLNRFRCQNCGITLSSDMVGKHKSFCSIHCEEFFTRYDFENPKICKECGRKFIPFRNTKFYKKVGGKYFCCMKCYIKWAKNHGGFRFAGSGGYHKRNRLGRKICWGCERNYQPTYKNQHYCTRPCYLKNQGKSKEKGGDKGEQKKR